MPRQSAAQQAAAPGQAVWKEDFEGRTNSWIDAGGDSALFRRRTPALRGGARRARQRMDSGCRREPACGWRQQGLHRPRYRPALGHRRTAAHVMGLFRSSRAAIPCGSDAPSHARSADWQTVDGDHRRLDRIPCPAAGSSLPSKTSRGLLHQVHILRSQLSLNVDSREAFVSRVLLNVYGGAGVTNVWTDDLEVYGHVPSSGAVTAAGSGPTAVPVAAHTAGGPANNNSSAAGPAAGPPEPLRRAVKLAGSVLTVNGYPIFPARWNTAASGWRISRSWASTPSGCGRSRRGSFFGKRGSLECGWSLRRPNDPASSPEGSDSARVRAGARLGPGPRADGRDAGRQSAAGERVQLADSRFSRPLICRPATTCGATAATRIPICC